VIIDREAATRWKPNYPWDKDLMNVLPPSITSTLSS